MSISNPADQAPAEQFVTAVLIAHDGASWLPQTLIAINNQSRPIDRIIAIDTGSLDSSAKLISAAGITVVPAPRDLGFGDAVELALAHLPAHSDEEWIWLLHDDCAPEAGALAELLQAGSERPNIAMLGPKLRGWYDRTHLLEIGVSIASNGARWTGLERRESDQGQHDQLREVMAVSTAAALIRRPVFEDLGGFDPNLDLFRDDVDFGWRLHTAGHGVVVVPSAIAYHAEAAASERRAIDVSEAFLHRPLLLDRRNAAYVLLVNSALWRLPWISLQILSTGIARALFNLLAKLPGYAGDEIGAVGWLFLHPQDIFTARRRRKNKRLLASGTIARFLPPRWSQVRMGWEYLVEVVMADLHGQSLLRRGDVLSTSSHDDDFKSDEELEILPAAKRPSFWRYILKKPQVLLFIIVSTLLLAIGRNRIGTITGGALSLAPNSGLDLLRQYVQNWHPIALGSASVAPPWIPLLGIGSAITAFNLPLFIQALFLLTPLFSLFITYRVNLRFGLSSFWAMAGAAIYALSPVVFTSLNQGRLGTLVIILLAPSLVLIQPFSRSIEESTWRRTFAVGLLVAVLGAFSPLMLLVWSLGQFGLFIGDCIKNRHAIFTKSIFTYLFSEQSDGLQRRAIVALLPYLLLAPWSVQMTLHPTQFFLEPGLPLTSGGRWSILLDNPGGAGAPPIWMISPILLFAITAVLVKSLRVSSLSATALISVSIAVSTYVVAGHGSMANVWTGSLITISGAILIPRVLSLGEKFLPILRGKSLGFGHFWLALLASVSIFSFIATPIWALATRSTSLVQAGQKSIMPAFVSALTDTPSRPKTLVIRDIAGSRLYAVSRGQDLYLGEPDESVALPDQITNAVNQLVNGQDSSGTATSQILGAYGIQYIYLLNAGDQSLIRAIDGSGGFARSSATVNGLLWRVTTAASRLQFVDQAGNSKALAAGEISAEGDLKSIGTLYLAEKFDPGWRVLLDGVVIKGRKNQYGLVSFSINKPGHFTLLHESTQLRAELSFELLLLLISIVMALPAGRRRGEVALEELV